MLTGATVNDFVLTNKMVAVEEMVTIQGNRVDLIKDKIRDEVEVEVDEVVDGNVHSNITAVEDEVEDEVDGEMIKEVDGEVIKISTTVADAAVVTEAAVVVDVIGTTRLATSVNIMTLRTMNCAEVAVTTILTPRLVAVAIIVLWPLITAVNQGQHPKRLRMILIELALAIETRIALAIETRTLSMVSMVAIGMLAIEIRTISTRTISMVPMVAIGMRIRRR